MKRLWFAFPLLTAAFHPAFADDPRPFYGQWADNDLPGMEKTLADWKKSAPGNGDWLAAEGYYLCAKAGDKAPLVPPPGLENPGAPGPVPGQSEDPPPDSRFNPSLLSQAVSCWQAVLQEDPWRLDVRLSLVGLYQGKGDFESGYNLLSHTLLMADKGWRNLRWLDGEKLPRRSSRLIPAAMQDFMDRCLDLNTPEGDEEARRLAWLTLTFYPNHAQAYRTLSIFFSRRQDWPRAMKYLLIANRKAPKDSSILCAIGDTLGQLGKKKEAGIFYHRVIALHNDDASLERARKQLGLEKE